MRSVEVLWEPNDITTANISFAVDHLAIDAETLANLQAIVDMRGQQS